MDVLKTILTSAVLVAASSSCWADDGQPTLNLDGAGSFLLNDQPASELVAVPTDETLPEPIVLESPALNQEEIMQGIVSPETYAETESMQTFIDFPQEQPSLGWRMVESVPHLLSEPVGPLGHVFERLLHTHHDVKHTDLSEHAIGIQPVPDRPRLLFECGETFLGRGFLKQGVELPTEAVWRPAIWVFGEGRTAIHYYDSHRDGDPVSEWAHRLDLFGQLNLTGTERFLLGLRPLDEEVRGGRRFYAWDFRNGDTVDGWNADIQTAFFEGDFGELFPYLDPYDSKGLDWGFSVGRMPILAQQGLLINEDMIDALTVTRNTLNGYGNLNLRMTGVYAWNSVNRNSAISGPNLRDGDSSMVGLLTESDFYQSTVNADVVYVYSEDNFFGDLIAFGVSGIQRTYGYDNTYNTSLHFLASFPTDGDTNYAQQGELLFAQISWTPHHTEDLVYLNAFYAIDQYTSPTRGPLQGGPLGQTGIVFSAPGVGRAGPPIAVRTNDTAGASLGYQLFFDHTRRQMIWEFGGQKEHDGPVNQGAIGSTMRYQQACGQHLIFVVDGFLTKQEGRDLSQGFRTEIRAKF